MSQDPFKDSREREKRNRGNFALGVARVVDVPDDAGHQIVIQQLTKTDSSTDTKPEPSTVMVPQKGDVALPKEGDLVVFGRFMNRGIIILGTIYSQQSSIRSYDAESRHIGSDSSTGLFLHGPFGVVPVVDEAPEEPPRAAVWYRSDLDEYRGMEDGTKVRFDTTPV